MDSSRGLSEHLRLMLRSGASARMLGRLRPEQAVTIGTELVAAGSTLPSAIALAIQPSDPRSLRSEDVLSSFDDLCKVLSVDLDSRAQAGWVYAQDLGRAILDGSLEPGHGASQLWRLYEIVGEVPGSDPLDMLQLHEAWDMAVGVERVHAEDRIRASAASVVSDAEAALAAMSVTLGFDVSNVRPQDVMPLFLRMCPSFLRTWYGIASAHQDASEPGGRLNYLDAASAAKHLVDDYRRNDRESVKRGFTIIEQLHESNDEYVRELATIGFLKNIQNHAITAGFEPASFEEFLGPVSRTSWRGLQTFWSGDVTSSQSADDEAI